MEDSAKIDRVMQFAVLLAGRNDDRFERELGRIHLIKCVYLADAEYAEANQGKTYTGTEWRFYHFGPWASPVDARVEKAMAAIQAEQHRRDSAYDSDWISWSKLDGELCFKLEAELPLRVCTAIKRFVKHHGRHTESLLHSVYLTRPMLNAAPGQKLTFPAVLKPEQQAAPTDGQATYTAKQVKQRNNRLRVMKEELKVRLDAKRRRRAAAAAPSQSRAPRYDTVFSEGGMAR